MENRYKIKSAYLKLRFFEILSVITGLLVFINIFTAFGLYFWRWNGAICQGTDCMLRLYEEYLMRRYYATVIIPRVIIILVLIMITSLIIVYFLNKRLGIKQYKKVRQNQRTRKDLLKTHRNFIVPYYISNY